MKLYCMCHEKNSKLESQHFGAPNLYAPYDEESKCRAVVLQQPMRCIKNGVKQFILTEPKRNMWDDKSIISPDTPMHEHHSQNVDFYECPNCGAKVCVE